MPHLCTVWPIAGALVKPETNRHLHEALDVIAQYAPRRRQVLANQERQVS